MGSERCDFFRIVTSRLQTFAWKAAILLAQGSLFNFGIPSVFIERKRAVLSDDPFSRYYDPKYFRSQPRRKTPKDSSIRYIVPSDLLASSMSVARIRSLLLSRARVPYSSGRRALGQLPEFCV